MAENFARPRSELRPLAPNIPRAGEAFVRRMPDEKELLMSESAENTGAAEQSTWEYFVTPLLLHNEAAILNNWGAKGWELVQIIEGPAGGNVAYLKRKA